MNFERNIKPRLDALDGLRGLLAVTVLLSHLIGSIFGWTNDRPFIGAYLSVVYFFIMSGFVLSYAHSNEVSIFRYVLIRLARLLPLHIFSTLLIIAIYKYNQSTGGYVSTNEVFSVSTIIKNLIFANGIYWETFYIINPPSWSISIEFWCSLLIPLVFNRIDLTLKIMLAILILFILIFVHDKGFQPSISIAAFSMLVGAICFELTQKPQCINKFKENNVLVFIVVSFFICLLGIYTEVQSRKDFIYLFAFIPLLFIDFTPEHFFLKKVLTSSVFQFLGFISFSLYLLHDAIIVSGVIFKSNSYLSLLIGIFLSMFFAYLYAKFIDVPLYRYLKRIINKI